MTTEALNPALVYYSIAIFFIGLTCLLHSVYSKEKESLFTHEVELESWNIKGLDLALMLTFIYLFIFGAGAMSLEGYRLVSGNMEMPEDLQFLFGFPMHFAILVSLFGIFRYYKLDRDIPINPVKPGKVTLLLRAFYYFFAAIPILMVGGFLWPVVLEFFNLPTDPQDLVTQVEEMAMSPIFLMVAFLAIVVAPISEEILFRGFIYRNLKTFVSPGLAAVITSLMFAGMHFNWLSFLPLFILGFWLCRSYEKTGNIFVPIILHGLFNANTLLVLFLMNV